MPKFSVTFTSTVEVTRLYDAEGRAEDGQIGPFPYDVVDAAVTDLSVVE